MAAGEPRERQSHVITEMGADIFPYFDHRSSFRIHGHFRRKRRHSASSVFHLCRHLPGATRFRLACRPKRLRQSQALPLGRVFRASRESRTSAVFARAGIPAAWRYLLRSITLRLWRAPSLPSVAPVHPRNKHTPAFGRCCPSRQSRILRRTTAEGSGVEGAYFGKILRAKL
jgi:hypothetical protein